MLLRPLFFFLLIFFVFPSCNYWKNALLLSKSKVTEKVFLEMTEFEFRKGLVVVKAHINGSEEPFEFIFDTGAYSSKVSRDLARQLGLQTKTSYKSGDSRDNLRKVEVVLLEEVKLGNLVFENIAAGILDYPEGSPIQCIAKDGIIGANLIRRCNWKMDFQQKKFWMADHIDRFEELDLEQGIPFKRPPYSGTPWIKIQLEGTTLKDVLIDVGSNGGLDIPRKRLKKLPDFLDNHKYIVNYDSTSSGIYGRAMDTTFITQVESIRIHHLKIPDWRVDFNQRGRAKIGMELLSAFNLYLDYQKKELYLLPQKEIKEYPLKVYGFIPDYSDPDYFLIKNLSIPSPAADAGLSIGDTLTHINGKRPAELFFDHCSYFFEIGKLMKSSDTLSMIRNKEEIFFD